MSDNAPTRYGEVPKKHSDVYDAISPARLAGSLKGKVVLVTGAGRGIGRSIALAFAEAGADVAVLARTRPQLEEVAKVIRTKYNRKTHVCSVDATDSAAVEAAVSEIESTLGPLDVVVPNAGVNLFRPFEYAPFEEWWRVMDINTRAPLMLAKHVLPSMKKRNTGSFVFISSRAGVLSLAGSSAYCVSKTALCRAVACLQLELDATEKSGIHMYSLHPGGVKTDMTLDALHPDLDKMRPGSCDRIRKAFENFVDTPELCAWTCVYLATGAAADVLRGRYLNVEDDVEDIVRQGEIVRKEGLYDLVSKGLGDVAS